MHYSPSGSSVNEDSPGKNTGVGCHTSSRASFQPRDWTQVSCVAGGFFTKGSPKNTGVGIHSLLQGIFPTQGSNRSLLHCRQILYQLSYEGSPCFVAQSRPTLQPHGLQPASLLHLWEFSMWRADHKLQANFKLHEVLTPLIPTLFRDQLYINKKIQFICQLSRIIIYDCKLDTNLFSLFAHYLKSFFMSWPLKVYTFHGLFLLMNYRTKQ